jgi:hypothetical protein
MSDVREVSTCDTPIPDSTSERISPRGIATIQGTKERPQRDNLVRADDASNHTKGRAPINSADYANDIYSFAEKNPELHAKYPEGVRFDADGYPDFSPYAEKVVEIEMKGNYTTDYTDANTKAGIAEIPEGYSWHHHQDCKTMQLLPSDLHDGVRHTGGVSVIKNERGK